MDYTCFDIDADWHASINTTDQRGVEWVTMVGCKDGTALQIMFVNIDTNAPLSEAPDIVSTLSMLYQNEPARNLVNAQGGVICVAKRVIPSMINLHDAPSTKQ